MWYTCPEGDEYMANYNLGLVSVSFRQHSPGEILEAMKETMLSCIEWGSDVHAPCHDSARLRDLSYLQKGYGIDCCSFGTYFRLGTTNINELEAYAEAAKILGTNILRIWCGNKKASDYSHDEKLAFFEEAQKAAAIAKKLNVILCMECHNDSYTQTLDGALELMQRISSNNFRMYWQPNQHVSFAQNTEYAKNISPYTKNIHVFNWKGQNKYPLSQAYGTWREYLSFFDKSKTLLLEFMPDNSIESLKTEADALCRITENM